MRYQPRPSMHGGLNWFLDPCRGQSKNLQFDKLNRLTGGWLIRQVVATRQRKRYMERQGRDKQITNVYLRAAHFWQLAAVMLSHIR